MTLEFLCGAPQSPEASPHPHPCIHPCTHPCTHRKPGYAHTATPPENTTPSYPCIHATPSENAITSDTISDLPENPENAFDDTWSWCSSCLSCSSCRSSPHSITQSPSSPGIQLPISPQPLKAKREVQLQLVWDEIEKISPVAAEYLRKIGDNNWISAAFPSRRYGIVTSNPVESSNSWLESARHKDPFSCLVTISDLLMERLSRLRAKYAKVYDERTLCEHAATVVRTNVMQGRLRAVIPSSDTIFKVGAGDGGSRVVNLDAKTCTCLKWEEFELPCVHVCAALHYRHSTGVLVSMNDPTLYSSTRYLYTTMKTMYSGAIFPTDTYLLQADTAMNPSTFVRKRCGRRQKKRIPSAGEK